MEGSDGLTTVGVLLQKRKASKFVGCQAQLASKGHRRMIKLVFRIYSSPRDGSCGTSVDMSAKMNFFYWLKIILDHPGQQLAMGIAVTCYECILPPQSRKRQ